MELPAGDHPFSLRLLLFIWLYREACRILVPQPGTEPGPSAMRAQILSTRPAGNSQTVHLFTFMYFTVYKIYLKKTNLFLLYLKRQNRSTV